MFGNIKTLKSHVKLAVAAAGLLALVALPSKVEAASGPFAALSGSWSGVTVAPELAPGDADSAAGMTAVVVSGPAPPEVASAAPAPTTSSRPARGRTSVV